MMEISRSARVFVLLLILLGFAGLHDPFLWSSDASEERLGCVKTSVNI